MVSQRRKCRIVMVWTDIPTFSEQLGSTVQGAQQTLMTLATPGEALIMATWNIEAVQSGVENLARGMTVFANALDELSRAHPFIYGIFSSCRGIHVQVTVFNSGCIDIQGGLHIGDEAARE